jgi:hypothetical protein
MSSDDDNATLVLQIIRAKTLFDVLSVGRDASPQEVSKSYKRVRPRGQTGQHSPYQLPAVPLRSARRFFEFKLMEPSLEFLENLNFDI